MRFWLLHSGEVPLQNQIAAQVSLGILSGELAPGERLPSVRALARRFHIHSNTVSLAYRRLERELWLEARRGSGMYVRQTVPGPPAPASPATVEAGCLDPLVASLVHAARRLGVTDEEVRGRLEHALARHAPAALLLLEPDPDLQRILMAELAAAVPLPVAACSYPAPGSDPPHLPPGTLALVLPSKAAAVTAALPPASTILALKVRSVPHSLEPWLPAPAESLVGIASRWAPFLEFARTMLIAAGFHSDSLLIRDPAEAGWREGLTEAAAVVCDAHTATELPLGVKAIPFRILADETVAELRALLER